MPNENSYCECSNYIDNDYICEITGTVCKCTPDGIPDGDECFTHSTKNAKRFMTEVK